MFIESCFTTANMILIDYKLFSQNYTQYKLIVLVMMESLVSS